jgi:hypothetical protein
MKTLYKILTYTAIGIGMMAALNCSGCSINTARESLTVNIPATADRPPVTLQWKAEITQVLWLYFTKTKQVERVTPFSSTCVGEIDAEPDPNSISAANSGVIPMLMKFFKKGQ